MKHFYNSDLAVNVQLIATTSGRASGSKARNFLTLTLLSIFMLLGGKGFSQVGTTFTAAGSGDWRTITWTKTGTASNTYPQSGATVIIDGGRTVTVSNAEECGTLTIYSRQNNGTGEPQAGNLEILGGGVLSVSSLTSNPQKNFPQAGLTIRANGKLNISGTNTIGAIGAWTNYVFEANSTVAYTGTTSSQPISQLIYQNLILSGSGTKTAQASLTVNQDLAILNSAEFVLGGFSHTVKGNLDVQSNQAKVTGNSATTGLSLIVEGELINNGVVAFVSRSLSVGKNFTANTGSSFIAGSGTHTITGNLANNGTLNAETSTIKLYGNYSGTGTFNKGTGSMSYEGPAQNIAALDYHNLTFSGTGNKTASGTIKVSGNLVHTGGTFVHGGQKLIYNGAAQNVAGLSYYDLEFAGTGVKTASSSLVINRDLTIKDAAEFAPGNFSHTVTGNLDVQSATAKISGNATTTGLNLTVGGELINNGGITFQSRNLSVAKNFTNSAGSTFTAGSGVHTVGGNWINAGTLNANLSTIILDGASKTISSTGTGAFNNLIVSNGASKLISDIAIDKELRLNASVLDTDVYKVVLSSTANILSTESATQHIKGTVETTRIVGTQTSEIFGNMGIRMVANTTSLGSVHVKRVTGKAFVSPVNGNSSVNRQFFVSSVSGLPFNDLNASIDMNFPDHDLPAPIAPSYDIYRHTVESDKNIIEMLANGSGDPIYKYRVANAQKFGMYTISSNITPLPVELAWFKAERQAQGVNLTWLTASEKDNSGFEVQVSTDGKKFSKIGFVKSAVTTSSVAQSYSFLDKNVASGTRYYRLAQIDLDGTTTYSYVKAIQVDGVKVAATAYPNPFAGDVTVQLPAGAQREVRAILTNAFGQQLSEQKVETSEIGQATVDMSSAKTSGIYILQVLDNGSKHTFKLMKQ